LSHWFTSIVDVPADYVSAIGLAYAHLVSRVTALATGA